MDIVKGKCSSLTSEGKGVVKVGDKVIFVDSLLLGEEADIEIIFKGRNYYLGKIRKLYNLSKDRISPLCPISTACGGCCFQNVTYDYECTYKENKVKEDLKRIAKIDIKPLPIIRADTPYYYRNKIQVPFGKEGNKIIYGFYKSNTHKIIPFSKCYIEDERSENILSNFAELMQRFKIDPYNEDKREGIIRHVLIRTSSKYNELMIVIVTNGNFFPSRGKFVKELLRKSPEITTIIQNFNHRDTNVILGNEERILYGPGYINDEILNLKFKVSSKSFFQVNHSQTEKLYSKAIELAELSKDDEVLDAYAGVATIGLLCAKHCKHVTSVELEKAAVINAKNNAKNNNINNITILEDDCTKFITRNNPHFDVVIMDPPRKGSKKEFISAVKRIKPKKVIYISCDPATLARDLSDFIDLYDVKTVQPVDMFPRTYHVETTCCLVLKENLAKK